MVCLDEPAHTAPWFTTEKGSQRCCATRLNSAAVFGIDIGKNVFDVVGIDTGGHVIQKATFRRDTLLQFFESTRHKSEARVDSQALHRIRDQKVSLQTTI
ncbi:hypothetical protein NLM27_25985 [Bradyrhizobium sp. CCGB12]|uniref:hypothetical protein n=1 Tax=Bradyrhizobium sp. CCGB12 TaxID=2949632 RepID=UPI0020B1F366|nr:hypothetical protein [Bradyrhizobium sp. CCGB12]MCP3392226.1 hypothetical protein [Bradyrhizobium sp. CCGB12]